MITTSTKVIMASLLLLLLGCATGANQPVKFDGEGSLPTDEAFRCALAQVASLGYSIETTDAQAGHLRAEKVFRRNVMMEPTTQRLTVLIAPRSTGGHLLTVTAENLEGYVGRQAVGKTSPQVRADAEAILASCSGQK